MVLRMNDERMSIGLGWFFFYALISFVTGMMVASNFNQDESVWEVRHVSSNGSIYLMGDIKDLQCTGPYTVLSDRKTLTYGVHFGYSGVEEHCTYKVKVPA